MKQGNSSHDGNKGRLRLATWGMGALFLVAAYSQAKLQTVERSHTLALAEKTNRFVITYVDKPKRGAIYSSDGKPLAQDAQKYELVVEFQKVPKSHAFFMDLSNATGIPASEFANAAEQNVRSKTWLDPISKDQEAEVNKVKARWKANGLSASNAGSREYPLGSAASSLIGIMLDLAVKDKETGKLVSKNVRTGLEGSKNKILEGTAGKRTGMTDRYGAFLPMRMSGDEKPRVDGKDLTLTIDSDLQVAAATAIRNAVEMHKATNGAVIVLHPKTGDILAMANWPSFDPASKQNGQFGYNAAYMAQLEPGSTFKILTLAKALDMGLVNMNSAFYCSGSKVVAARARPVRCDLHGGTRAHRQLDPEKAIAKSCNVWAATWAQQITRPAMIEYIEALGILEPTGIGVSGEQAGLFRRDEYAKDLQLAHVGFGQSITATPLGLASAFSMIANGGVRMKPRLIKKIGDYELPVENGQQIIGKDAAADVLECMEAVIQTDMGTGKKLRIAGYRLGGKTGTAEKVGSKPKGYVSNFIGFVPAQNPEAVILVMVNDPKVGYYGGEVAGPAFTDIARATIRRMNIPPSEAQVGSNTRQ